MPDNRCRSRIEDFVAWGTDPEDEVPIVRHVDSPDFQEFQRQCRACLEEMAGQWASGRMTCRTGSGRAIRERRGICGANVDMEWRVRNT